MEQTQEPDLGVFLHTNPVYDMEQNQRYDSLVTQANKMQGITKLVSQYANLGHSLCGSLQSICEGIQEFDIVITEPAMQKLFQSIVAVQKGLAQHFAEVEAAIMRPFKSFMKHEMDKLVSTYKQYNQDQEKYIHNTEKYLAQEVSDPEEMPKHKFKSVQKYHKKSSLSYFDYKQQVDLTETRMNSLVADILIAYTRSIKTACEEPVLYLQNNQSVIDGIANSLATQTAEMNQKLYDSNKEKVAIKNAVETYWNSGGENNLSLSSGSSCENIVTKQGYIWKKCGKIKPTWNRRYCNCANGMISLSESIETAHNPKWSKNLMFCTVKPTTNEARSNCFMIVTKEKTLVFQAQSKRDKEEWISVLSNGISGIIRSSTSARLVPTVQKKTYPKCVDCGQDDSSWIILNKGAHICEQCAGVHRSLPASVSRVRSVVLDTLDPYSEYLIKQLQSDSINEVLESNVGDEKIDIEASRKDRTTFINKKYVERAYVDPSIKVPDPYEAIRNQDLDMMLKYICLSPDMMKENEFNLLHAAACVGNPLMVCLIAMNTSHISSLDENGWSSLSYAAYHRNYYTCDVLLLLGANPNSSKVAHPYSISVSLNDSTLIKKFEPYSSEAQIQRKFKPPNKDFEPQMLKNFNPAELKPKEEEKPLPGMVISEQKRLREAISSLKRGNSRRSMAPAKFDEK